MEMRHAPHMQQMQLKAAGMHGKETCSWVQPEWPAESHMLAGDHFHFQPPPLRLPWTTCSVTAECCTADAATICHHRHHFQ